MNLKSEDFIVCLAEEKSILNNVAFIQRGGNGIYLHSTNFDLALQCLP